MRFHTTPDILAQRVELFSSPVLIYAWHVIVPQTLESPSRSPTGSSIASGLLRFETWGDASRECGEARQEKWGLIPGESGSLLPQISPAVFWPGAGNREQGGDL